MGVLQDRVPSEASGRPPSPLQSLVAPVPMAVAAALASASSRAFSFPPFLAGSRAASLPDPSLSDICRPFSQIGSHRCWGSGRGRIFWGHLTATASSFSLRHVSHVQPLSVSGLSFLRRAVGTYMLMRGRESVAGREALSPASPLHFLHESCFSSWSVPRPLPTHTPARAAQGTHVLGPSPSPELQRAPWFSGIKRRRALGCVPLLALSGRVPRTL